MPCDRLVWLCKRGSGFASASKGFDHLLSTRGKSATTLPSMVAVSIWVTNIAAEVLESNGLFPNSI
jgi:hypothetical protein